MDRILNIYGQAMEHQESRMVGNKAALEALKDAIDNALSNGKFFLGAVGQPLYSSDGEGYCIEIKLKPDDWWAQTLDDEDLPFYHRIM